MLTVGQEGLGPPSDGPIAGGTCSNGFPDFRVDIGLCLVCLQLILEALFWVSSCLLAAGLFSKQNYRWELRGTHSGHVTRPMEVMLRLCTLIIKSVKCYSSLMIVSIYSPNLI